MTFSWEQKIKRAQELKLERAKNLARGNINPDYDIAHPNEIREFAKTGTHTELTKRIKEEHLHKTKQALDRREKLK